MRRDQEIERVNLLVGEGLTSGEAGGLRSEQPTTPSSVYTLSLFKQYHRVYRGVYQHRTKLQRRKDKKTEKSILFSFNLVELLYYTILYYSVALA